MRKYIIFGLLIVMIVVSAAAMAAAYYSGPTKEELSNDINALSSEITIVQSEMEKYEQGSILWLQVNLRLKALETTRQMLEQKRSSIIRGIELKFTQDGRELPAVDPATLKALDEEIASATSAADAAQAKAAQYSTGLIRGMSLVEEATHRATVAMIKERRAILMLGYALPAAQKMEVPLPGPVAAPSISQSTPGPQPALEGQSPPSVQPVAEPITSRWVVSESKSPLDDSSQVVASLSADSGDAILLIRCKENSTDVYINTKEYLGRENIRIIYRLGDGKPVSSNWDASTKGTAAFSRSPIDFLKNMSNNEKLFMRITAYSGSVDAIFYLDDIDGVRSKVASACSWSDKSKAETKQSEKPKATSRPDGPKVKP